MPLTRAERRRLRRRFLWFLWDGLRVTWPILSGLLLAQTAAGAAIGWLEGWGPTNGIYFAFITGLTVGYGDFVPAQIVTKGLAVSIGLIGVLTTGLVAAIGVRALDGAMRREPRPVAPSRSPR